MTKVFSLQETLYERFSQYGLVYEVQVMTSGLPANPTATIQPGANSCKSPEVSGAAIGQVRRDVSGDCSDRGYYAFVKFYSTIDAGTALKDLRGRFYLKGQHAKVRLAQRKALSTPQPLRVNKCYSLANHYLGFNGWHTRILTPGKPLPWLQWLAHTYMMYNLKCYSPETYLGFSGWHTRILTMKTDVLDEAPSGEQSVGYFCVLRLELEHGLHADGVGIAQQSWSLSDLSGRGAAMCRAKKRAYQQATEDAFSKILLVTLSGGKVHVEVNTTVEEKLHHSEGLDLDAMLTVTEQTVAPPGETKDDLEEVDLINHRILEELVVVVPGDEC
ncbi:RAD52 motif-containing protein 1 [Lamellibrachia satsuma]|nr:RAD52 motif-containing protein 1 [Lamellibrachia satsuma]